MRDKIKGRRINWDEARATRFPDLTESPLCLASFNFSGGDPPPRRGVLGDPLRFFKTIYHWKDLETVI
jgi:hypothetical protein